jgi:phenylacetate-CoA ligase
MKDRFFLNEIQCSYTSLLTNPRTIYKKISHFRPKLVGSAALAILADFMAKDGLTAGDWLKAFVSWGMPLSSEQVHSISNAFCSNIFDRYGSAELGGQVAQQCSERTGLHINTELCLIEVLRNGEPCADGERGRLVITNLSNLATPFVRYEQNDTAVCITDCACGRTLPSIAQIAGKDPSLIEMKNGVRIPQALLHSLVRRMNESSNVEQISFRKASSSNLVLTLVPGQGFDLRNIERIRERLTTVLGSMAIISVEVISRQTTSETSRHTL